MMMVYAALLRTNHLPNLDRLSFWAQQKDSWECLVASHSLPQLNLGKCGKPQKVWLANWLPHFVMPKGILSYFLTL